ncbi:MAG: class I SAM-dependent methyltransferase [Chloroflexota bacterium]
MPSPTPCDCPGCPNVFSGDEAEKDLRRYREKGPDPTTRALLDAIRARGIDGATVLDIGGGVGAIQLELLAAGAASTVSVDASTDFVAVARAEAERRGFADRTRHLAGDFVALADELDPADVVTLDKVVCCYRDFAVLIDRSASHARRMLGLVYPRDASWVRAIARIMNLGYRLFRRPTRFHIHPQDQVDRLIRDAGFEAHPVQRGVVWQVVVYDKAA